MDFKSDYYQLYAVTKNNSAWGSIGAWLFKRVKSCTNVQFALPFRRL